MKHSLHVKLHLVRLDAVLLSAAITEGAERSKGRIKTPVTSFLGLEKGHEERR